MEFAGERIVVTGATKGIGRATAILLAGKGGGSLKNTGRYVQAKEQPLANLFLTMADGMGGQELVSHGDSTGRFG